MKRLMVILVCFMAVAAFCQTRTGTSFISSFGVGEELAPVIGATGWTGTNWTIESGGKYATHGTGTNALYPTSALSITAGSYYRVSYTISTGSTISGNVVVTLGGVTVATETGTGDRIYDIITLTTASLAFTPTNTYNGILSGISVKPLKNGDVMADGTVSGKMVLASGILTIPKVSSAPINGVAASKVLTVNSHPLEGETVTMGLKTYKARRDALSATGVKASAVLTSDNTEVTDGDTVTVNNITYRFKDTMAAINDVKRHGTNADTTLANLVAAINGSGTEGVEYYAGTVAATGVEAGAVASHAITVTADAYGVAGNLFPKAETSTHLDWDGVGAVFTGGVDPEAANDIYTGGTAEAFIDNLVLAVTAGAGQGTNYGTGTTVNAYCTGAKASAATFTATALVKGIAGNNIAITEDLNDVSSKWAGDATKLSGGVDGTVAPKGSLCFDGTYYYLCLDTQTIADANWRRISVGSSY